MRDATKHAVSIGGWCGEDEPTNPEQLAEWSNKCLRPKSREVECRWLAWRTSGWFWRVLRWFTLRFTFVTLESIYDSIKNVFASQRRKHKIGKERKITCSGSAGSDSTEIWGGEGGERGPRLWGRENWFFVPTKDGFWSHRVNQYVTSCMKDSDKCTCTLIYLFWSTLIILTQTESGHLQAFHFSWGSKSRILRWRFRLVRHWPLVSLHLNLAMTN